MRDPIRVCRVGLIRATLLHLLLQLHLQRQAGGCVAAIGAIEARKRRFIPEPLQMRQNRSGSLAANGEISASSI